MDIYSAIWSRKYHLQLSLKKKKEGCVYKVQLCQYQVS